MVRQSVVAVHWPRVPAGGPFSPRISIFTSRMGPHPAFAPFSPAGRRKLRGCLGYTHTDRAPQNVPLLPPGEGARRADEGCSASALRPDNNFVSNLIHQRPRDA